MFFLSVLCDALSLYYICVALYYMCIALYYICMAVPDIWRENNEEFMTIYYLFSPTRVISFLLAAFDVVQIINATLERRFVFYVIDYFFVH
jgi:hypothetical protein